MLDKQTYNEIITLVLGSLIGSIVKFFRSGNHKRKFLITGLIVGVGSALTLGKLLANMISKFTNLELEGYMFLASGYCIGVSGDMLVKKLLSLLTKQSNDGNNTNRSKHN